MLPLVMAQPEALRMKPAACAAAAAAAAASFCLFTTVAVAAAAVAAVVPPVGKHYQAKWLPETGKPSLLDSVAAQVLAGADAVARCIVCI